MQQVRNGKWDNPSREGEIKEEPDACHAVAPLFSSFSLTCTSCLLGLYLPQHFFRFSYYVAPYTKGRLPFEEK